MKLLFMLVAAILLAATSTAIADDVAASTSSDVRAPEKGPGNPAALMMQDAEVYMCGALTCLYVIHLIVVLRKHREFEATNAKNENYTDFKHSIKFDEKWRFLLATLVLPLGTGLLSAFFGEDGVWRHETTKSATEAVLFGRSSFIFAKAVFLLMITLEMAYLLNLQQRPWRDMLVGALILDFLAFLGFTLVREPDNAREVSTDYVIWVLVVGMASILSSLFTIYYSRQLDQFGATDKPKPIEVLSKPAFPKKPRPQKES